ncbi:hypothetical protein GCM10010393_16110 [Streptomyces gobitricini]|uniref:Uncharacterized protein n=1 Tax=Streptomyces gobitricini TaxID=68211 RepID=A0ABN3LK68_9ACTN
MAGKVPEGYVRVRSYLRRKPAPGRKKMSGWSIAAIVAGVWLWGQVVGFGEATDTPANSPAPSLSQPASR